MTPTDHAYRLLAERMARDIDAEIHTGLERVLGKTLPAVRSDALVAALGTHRLSVQRDNAGNETYFVDGVAFLHVGPPQLGAESNVVTVERRVTHYEVLR